MIYFIQHPEVNIDLYAALNLFGCLQGFALAYFFMNKTHRQNPANLYIGLLLLAASISSFDSFLGYTNYMFRIIRLNDFSEPLALLIGPFFYLYITAKLTNKKPVKTIYHYLVPLIYALYMLPYHFAEEAVKYNAYISAYHPDLQFQTVENDFIDILHLQDNINELLAVSFILYGLLSVYKFVQLRQLVDEKTRSFLQVNLIYYFSIIMVFLVIKLFNQNDLGDYILNAATAVIIYSISIYFLGQSLGFKESSARKYQKSALTQEFKDRLLKKIETEMKENKFYLNLDAGLPDLAKQIDSNPNHVSQVINECLSMNYFELIAQYRVEHAKSLLESRESQAITIEEIASSVGYLSKSAFNKAFKKVTATTPSEYRQNYLNNQT